MANRTFNIPKSKSTPKRVKIAGTIDVAARPIAIAAQVTGSSIQHPGRNRRNHAGCRLEIDIAAGEALLAAVLPDTTPIKRMPAIVDLDLWPDMGRMTG
jgi:hypothetical protein